MTQSPYLSLRHAVRPAIFAHQLLAGDQERAGKLVAECEELLLLTRELLKATGNVHVLEEQSGPEPGGDPRAQLLDAYADAGMIWAKVVGSSMALAAALLEQNKWDEVRRLASFFQDAGEMAVAADLRVQLGEAVWDAYHEQLRHVNPKMPPAEIQATIQALRTLLREVPEDFPDRNAKVNFFLRPLAASIQALMSRQNTEISYDSRVGHIAAGGVAKYPDIVKISLDELTTEFEAIVRG